jgi:hypothetical protein
MSCVVWDLGATIERALRLEALGTLSKGFPSCTSTATDPQIGDARPRDVEELEEGHKIYVEPCVRRRRGALGAPSAVASSQLWLHVDTDGEGIDARQ